MTRLQQGSFQESYDHTQARGRSIDALALTEFDSDDGRGQRGWFLFEGRLTNERVEILWKWEGSLSNFRVERVATSGGY